MQIFTVTVWDIKNSIHFPHYTDSINGKSRTKDNNLIFSVESFNTKVVIEVWSSFITLRFILNLHTNTDW